MHTAGARALRADDNEMSREAARLQWEQKIEAAERREEEDRAEAEDASRAEAALAEAALADGSDAPLPGVLPAVARERQSDRGQAGTAAGGIRQRAPAASLRAPQSTPRSPPAIGAPSRSRDSLLRPAGVAQSLRRRSLTRPDRPLGVPAGPLPGGRCRRDRARRNDPLRTRLRTPQRSAQFTLPRYTYRP